MKCTVDFGGFDGFDDNGIYKYSWECYSDSAENNTNLIWKISGNWRVENYNNKSVLTQYADMVVNQITEEDAGTYTFYRQTREKVGMDGPFDVYDWTGEFERYEPIMISCVTTGSTPSDAKCVIARSSYLEDPIMTIKYDSLESYDWDKITKIA